MNTPNTIDRDAVELLLFPVWTEATAPILAVGDGWLPLIYDLGQKLLELDPNIKILQIKTKFGGLRIYAMTQSKMCRDLIREAEAAAEFICENCGNPGRTGDAGSWSYVYCEDCRPAGWEPYNPEDDKV